jgi:AbrB family looped-hinge helix DNA binding protein
MTKLDEATITSQGQISLPKRVRERLHVGKGDKVAFFEDEKGQIVVKEMETPVPFSASDWAAFLDKVQKEPVTRVEGKAAAIKHLQKLRKK